MSVPKETQIDLDAIKNANPTEYAQADVFESMEFILARLDGTYAMTDIDGADVDPEDAYKRRVEIMCGIIKTALDTGRERGLSEAAKRMHKVIYGLDSDV